MIEIFSILEAYNKIRPLTETDIYSKLQGYIKVILDYKGKIIREPLANVMYNRFGKVFDSGDCLLFPDDKGTNWNDFIKELIVKEHEKELIQGSVCLVKRQYTSDPWVLAIYNQKLENNYYQAKVGKEFEEFQYCIAYDSNKEYLGRESFPSWLTDEEVD